MVKCLFCSSLNINKKKKPELPNGSSGKRQTKISVPPLLIPRRSRLILFATEKEPFTGRSSGFCPIASFAFPFDKIEQWRNESRMVSYSGGPAPEFHRLPDSLIEISFFNKRL